MFLVLVFKKGLRNFWCENISPYTFMSNSINFKSREKAAREILTLIYASRVFSLYCLYIAYIYDKVIIYFLMRNGSFKHKISS